VNWQDPNLPPGFITLRQQLGIGAGLTVHAAANFHVTLEYFYALFQWYKPTPAPAGQGFPHQVLNFVNAGVTYDF